MSIPGTRNGRVKDEDGPHPIWQKWHVYSLAINFPECICGQVPGRGVRVRHPDCTAQAAADCVSGASCSASCFVVTPGVR